MKKFLLLFRAAIGLLILGFLFYTLDFSKVINTILGVNPIILVLAVLHYLVNVFFNSLSLYLFARASKIRIRFWKMLKEYLSAFSMGMFFPGKLGEVSLSYLLEKSGVTYGKSFSLFVISKFVVLFTVIVLSVFGFILLFGVQDAIKVGLFSFALLIFMIVLVSASIVRNFVKRHILRKYSAKLNGFYSTLSLMYRKRKSTILIAIMITLLRMATSGVVVYLMFLLYGVEVPVYIVPMISSMGLLVSIIPISISGLGLKESTYVYLYSRILVDPVIAGSVFLMLTSLYYFFAAVILIFRPGGFVKNQ